MKLLHIVENLSQSLRQCWIAGVPRWRRHGSGTQASGQLSFEDNVSLDQIEPNDKRQREEQGQGWIRLCGYCLTAAQVLCHGEWRGEELLRLRTHVLSRTCANQWQPLVILSGLKQFSRIRAQQDISLPAKDKYILIGRMSVLPTEKIQQNAENFEERRCYVGIEIRK